MRFSLATFLTALVLFTAFCIVRCANEYPPQLRNAPVTVMSTLYPDMEPK